VPIIDLAAASSFLTTHGRLLERRRLAFHLGVGDPLGVAAALDGYRNPDGGYGLGLEPDLRAAESQPAAAMHALEVLAELGPLEDSPAEELFDWLESVSLPDGGLPFALPIAEPTGCAPFWVGADDQSSSLQITTPVVGHAHRVAHHDPSVAGHPWLAAATAFCTKSVERIEAEPHAYELKFALQFVDAVPVAARLIDRLAPFVPSSGLVPVAGGRPDERLHPLDLAPFPDAPSRVLFSDEVVAADLERLAALQQPDGGWVVDYESYSPAAALEWRGYATVQAVVVLQANGV
jgi:hypothetical protein